MIHLPLLNQILYRARDVFDGHVGVNPMLIQQVNHIDLQPLQRALDGLLDVRRPPVQAWNTLFPSVRFCIVSPRIGSFTSTGTSIRPGGVRRLQFPPSFFLPCFHGDLVFVSYEMAAPSNGLMLIDLPVDQGEVNEE